MRDRLIEILKESHCVDIWDCYNDVFKEPNPIETLADYLLANGVIVPPYEVGAKVYVITSQTGDNRNLYIFEDTITRYIICANYTIMCFENHLGVPTWNWNNVFLTREEAEAKLKGEQ